MAEGYSRREILEKVSACVALTMMTLSAVPSAALAQQKVAKSMVQYQDSPKGGHQCAGCSNFAGPASCKVVSGTISAHGWCSIWTPM